LSHPQLHHRPVIEIQHRVLQEDAEEAQVVVLPFLAQLELVGHSVSRRKAESVKQRRQPRHVTANMKRDLMLPTQEKTLWRRFSGKVEMAPMVWPWVGCGGAGVGAWGEELETVVRQVAIVVVGKGPECREED
jgi:hypothetical protein